MHRFTDLVGWPPAGARTFTDTARPGFADCAPSGRTRLDALARWLQDVAYADVADAGLAQAAVWVVRRTRISVARFPRFGEQFRLTTFCSGLGRMWAERRTTIKRLETGDRARAGAGDVEAVSLWVHLDPLSWRPMPLTEAEHARYGDAAAGRRVSARLRHPSPPAARDGGPTLGGSQPWTFRATECDIAGHINNAAYWTALEELLLAAREPQRLDAEIEYRTPAQPGVKRVLRDGERLWITDHSGETHASIMLESGHDLAS